MIEVVEEVLGLGEEAFELGIVQMMLRAVVVYVVAVAVVRVGSKRFMGRNTAFDLILAIVLGSVLSRGITGQSPFLPTMLAGVALVAAHWLIASLCCRFRVLSPLVKGEDRLLVKDGEILERNMRRSLVGNNDLMEALRANGHAASVDSIREARLERSGDISVILKENKPRVLDVRVEDGVQTVRIELQ